LQDLSRRAYPRSHFQRGQFFAQKGDPNSALIEFLKATQENPRLVRAFYEQALIFEQRGYLKLAESSLQQALSVDPQYQKARVLLATIQLKQGNIGGAANELARSLGLPENSQGQKAARPEDQLLDDAPKAVPPPSLLQVLHNILPEPQPEPQPAQQSAPQPAQQDEQGGEPTYQLPPPSTLESSPAASREKRTGFAGMPALPQEAAAKKPKGELDDILKDIPGIDPNVPASSTSGSQTSFANNAEGITAAGSTASDDKQHSSLRRHKEKRGKTDLLSAAPPDSATKRDSKSHIHLLNPFELFKQKEKEEQSEETNEKKSPKPSARAEKLGQKAEKLKSKAEKLRKKADKLGLKEEKQSEGLDSEPPDANRQTLTALPEDRKPPAPTRHRSEKSAKTHANKGFFSGLFSIFQPETPPAVSALRESEQKATSEKKRGGSERGREKFEPFGMVVRQPQAPVPPKSQLEQNKPAANLAEHQPQSTGDQQQSQDNSAEEQPKPVPSPKPRKVERAPASLPAPAPARQKAAQVLPTLPTPGQLISSITSILSPPVRPQQTAKRSTPQPAPQAVYTYYQPSEIPAIPAQRQAAPPSQQPAPLAIAMQSLPIRQEQAPRPAATAKNQWMVTPQLTSAGQTQANESGPAPAPAATGRSNLVYEAPAPSRPAAQPLEPLLVRARVPDASTVTQNTVVQSVAVAAINTPSLPQASTGGKIVAAPPTGQKASGSNIVIPPPPPGSGPAAGQPLSRMNPIYDQSAPHMTPPAQAAALPAASSSSPRQATPPAANWRGQRFEPPAMPSSKMTWLALPPGQSQAGKQAQAPQAAVPAPDEDEWTKRLRYLSEHGTASLKPGEAFMFSEETGEAVLFMPKGESIRRHVAAPQDPDEVVKARRPDILQPQDLQYNLSLLGKLLPHQPEQPSQTNQSTDKSDPLANFNISDVLRNSNRFWDWLKQSVSF
jgi:hypothetical protein